MTAIKIDWKKIKADYFEEIVVELLGKIGWFNVRRLGGSGDRGRDILANRKIEHELPNGIPLTENWIVECKLRTSRSIGVSSFSNSVSWADAHKPDGFILVTNTRLSPDALDWFDMPRSFKIRQISDQILEEYLIVYCNKLYLSLPKTYSKSNDQGVLKETISSLPRSLFKTGSKIPDSISNQLNKLSWPTCVLQENHRLTYQKDGNAIRYVRTVVANLSEVPLASETRRVFGDKVPLNKEFLIKSEGLRLFKSVIGSDTDKHERLLECYFLKPAERYEITVYEIEYNWPYPILNREVRHYTIIANRPKFNVSVEIIVPNNIIIDTCSMQKITLTDSIRYSPPNFIGEHSSKIRSELDSMNHHDKMLVQFTF